MVLMMMMDSCCSLARCFLLSEIRGGRAAVAAYWSDGKLGGDDDYGDVGDDDGGRGVSKEDGRFANCSLASNFGSALVPSQYGQLHRKMVNWSGNWSIGWEFCQVVKGIMTAATLNTQTL